MKLEEVNVPFEKHRFITYNSKGDKVVYHNVEVQNIFKNIYKGENEGNTYNKFCNIYVLYEGSDVGMWVTSVSTDYDLSEIVSSIKENFLQNKTAYISRLEHMIKNNAYVKLPEIELAKYVAPELVDKLITARNNRLKIQEAKSKEMKERKKREEEDRAQKDNEDAKVEIENFINKIKNGGIFENSEITIHENGIEKTYNTVIYLMEKNGIKIHIRTKGWVMSNVRSFTFKDGKCVSISYINKHFKSKSKGSTKIFDLIKELTDIIMEAK